MEEYIRRLNEARMLEEIDCIKPENPKIMFSKMAQKWGF